jgi:septal ring factor EnvC (AmiA/AmiB activator)
LVMMEVYYETEDDLRRLMVQRACEHIHIMTGREYFNELLKKIPELSVDVVSEMAELLKQRTADINSKDHLLEEEHERLVASQTSLTNKTQECNGLERALISKKRLLVEIRDGLEYNNARIAQGVLKI